MDKTTWQLRGAQRQGVLKAAIAAGSPFSIFIHYYSDDGEVPPVQDEVRLTSISLESEQPVTGADEGACYDLRAQVEAGPAALLGLPCRVKIEFPTYEGTFELV